MSENLKNDLQASEVESGKNVIYCFCYQKMLYLAGAYRYFVCFMQMEKGVATNAVLSTIDDDKRTLAGWHDLLKKAADKISDSKYILFRDSFNFIMNTDGILPDTIYCNNIGDIPYDEEYRDETLSLANQIESSLSSLRVGDDFPSTFAAFSDLLKNIGTAEISIV